MTATSAPGIVRVINLRRWLPLLLGGLCLLLLSMLLLIQQIDTRNRLHFFADHSARETLLATQLDLEAALQSSAYRSVDSIITSLGLHADIDRAVLTDEQGLLLAATRFAWKGKPLQEVWPELSQQVSRTHGVLLDIDLNARRLQANVPVAMPRQNHQIRSQQQGQLWVVYDMAPRIAVVEGLMWQRILWMGAILFLATALLHRLMHWLIMRPVSALQEGIERIGKGDFHSLPVLQGDGELRRLGDALNTMATALKANNEALRESEERFRQLSDGAFEAVLVHENGVILNANAAAERLWHVPQGDLIGHPLLSLIAPHDHANVLERVQEKRVGIWIVDVVDSQGQTIPTEVSVRHHQAGERVLHVVSLRDLRERMAAEEEVHRLTNLDALTGLGNRRQLLAYVDEELEAVSRNRQRAALAVLDLDNFKSINDSLGMAFGDKVLRAVAKRLNTHLEKGQFLARVNANTFALLFTGLNQASSEATAAYVGRRIEQLLLRLAEPLILDQHTLHLNACAGVVMIPNDVGDAPELLREAETAMHLAKQEEGARLRFFSHALQETAKERLSLRNDLRHAISLDLGQFCLHYQPQVSADGQTLLGVEALVRWQHPQKGLISPLAFIPEAEASGLIVPLGYLVMEQAITCLQRLRQSEATAHWANTLRMGINVSPRQFREADFIPRVEELLAQVGVDALSLELELTESVLAEDLDATLEKMQSLRRLGVHFALDDFGTGYSSLSYLKRLPINTLKIDRSFVMDIDAPHSEHYRQRQAALIDAIVTVAHQFDLRVLAEGGGKPRHNAHA